MSRSYRHSKIIGNTTASSEKFEKRKCNRILRKRIREQIRKKNYDSFLDKRSVSDVWNWPKDGKSYRKNLESKDLRK